jgi:hypothetical protein
MIESAALTICYVCTMMAFLWFTVLDFGSSDPAFAFWYPSGTTSFVFTLIAFGNDLVQDATAHVIGHLASGRHEKSDSFTARPSGPAGSSGHGMAFALWKALKAAGGAVWCFGILTSSSFWLVQAGYIGSRSDSLVNLALNLNVTTDR